VSVALLIGTVPMTLIKIQVNVASTPAHRNAKPGSAPSRTVMAIPDTAIGTKKEGTSTRSLSTSQDTSEEHIHEVEDGGGIHIYFSFHFRHYHTMRYIAIVIRSINDISLIVKGAKKEILNLEKTRCLRFLIEKRMTLTIALS